MDGLLSICTVKPNKTALYSLDFSIVCHKTDKGVVLWHTL